MSPGAEVSVGWETYTRRVLQLFKARRWSRAWKKAARKARFDVMLLKSINRGNREVYEVRIAELEKAAREVLEKP